MIAVEDTASRMTITAKFEPDPGVGPICDRQQYRRTWRAIHLSSFDHLLKWDEAIERRGYQSRRIPAGPETVKFIGQCQRVDVCLYVGDELACPGPSSPRIDAYAVGAPGPIAAVDGFIQQDHIRGFGTTSQRLYGKITTHIRHRPVMMGSANKEFMMDSRHVRAARPGVEAAPRIQQLTAPRWVAATPVRTLNAALAVAWLAFLWSIGLFSAPQSDTVIEPLSFADNLALAMFLVTLGGIIAVVALAIANSRHTAIVSAGSAMSMVVIGTTCGFAGHPISAWGPNTGSAAVIALASLAIMSRRAV